MPFADRTDAALAHWTKEDRPHFPRGERSWLVPSETGAQGSASAVHSAARTAAMSTGIGFRLHPRLLRHSCATRLLEGGVNIREVQDLLGDTSLATTEMYNQVRPERSLAA